MERPERQRRLEKRWLATVGQQQQEEKSASKVLKGQPKGAESMKKHPKDPGIKLSMRHVFITNGCDEPKPEWPGIKLDERRVASTDDCDELKPEWSDVKPVQAATKPISNASDALDKTCYEATTDPEETGIGTTKNEVINNVGTIAKTGIQALTVVRAAGGDISMTEQLGVGFYSPYPVSGKVRVDGKRNDDEQYMRESGTGGSYTAQKDAGPVHGEVKRHLNDLVKEHPECIGFPTELRAEKSKEKVVTDSGNGMTDFPQSYRR